VTRGDALLADANLPMIHAVGPRRCRARRG
jgi:hypothetical protein